MEENKTLIIGLALFVVIALGLQSALYHDSLYTNDAFANTIEEISQEPPAWFDLISWGGLIVASVSYIFTCLWNVMSFNIPEMPTFIRIIFLTPVWIATGILFFEIVHKVIKAFPTT